MLFKQVADFKAECDVCGHTEHFDAQSHAEAWRKMERAAWCVRKNAAPIIHVCPECPAEAPKLRA